MDVDFAERWFGEQCNSNRELVRAYGPERASLLRRRLDQLRAVESLDAMRFLPAHCHELTGDSEGILSVDLDGTSRLLFEPAQDPPPVKGDGGLDWSKVTAIRILREEDTHEQ